MAYEKAKRELNGYCKEMLYQDAIKLKLDNLLKLDINLINEFNQAITQKDKLLEKSIQRTNFIEEKIDMVDQPYKAILFERYIERKNFEEISDILNFSVPRIFQLYKVAHKKYDEISKVMGYLEDMNKHYTKL